MVKIREACSEIAEKDLKGLDVTEVVVCLPRFAIL